MGTKPDLWDPQTCVSFPRPDRRANAEVKFEHDGVRFAVAPQWSNDCELGEPTAAAHFVEESLFYKWWRISQTDYEMIIARCKADPSGKLFVAPCVGYLNFVFRPAEFRAEECGTNDLCDPPDNEVNVTVIRVRRLEHREVAA